MCNCWCSNWRQTQSLISTKTCISRGKGHCAKLTAAWPSGQNLPIQETQLKLENYWLTKSAQSSLTKHWGAPGHVIPWPEKTPGKSTSTAAMWVSQQCVCLLWTCGLCVTSLAVGAAVMFSTWGRVWRWCWFNVGKTHTVQQPWINKAPLQGKCVCVCVLFGEL